MIPLHDGTCQISAPHDSENRELPDKRADEATNSWQQILSQAVKDRTELARLLELDEKLFDEDASGQFPLLVPDPWLARIRKGDPRDPLLLQVLPAGAEMINVTGYQPDPLEERNASPVTGVIRKFEGRVLVMASGACGINCRYCFRRHYPYRDGVPDRSQWEEIFDYLNRDATVTEVILSGGDPLVQSDRTLTWILSGLQQIEHLRRVRIHTRMPVIIPQRISPALLGVFASSSLRQVLVIHCNHPRELDDGVREALSALAGAGVVLLNQSVLLRGVNDSPETIVALCEDLFDAGVQPYYMHMLDRVAGAAHFEVPESRALQIREEIEKALPGYLVPRFVRELPGADSKAVLPAPAVRSGTNLL